MTRMTQGNADGEAPCAEDGRFISTGSAAFVLEGSTTTRDFYFLLLPKMTMLAFSAALEPLRIANQLTGKCLYRWFLLSEDGLPVRCSNGVSIVVDGAYAETKPSDNIFVCSGVDGYLAASRRSVGWIRDQARHGRVIGGLCTGAFTLARAGLLEGRSFTLHWENQPAFEETFPDLVISKQIFCIDGNIVTCGGGNAAVDLVVSMVERQYGNGLATKVAEMCLHGKPRGGDHSQRLSISAELGLRHPALAKILLDLKANSGSELDMECLAARHGLSRRQIERLFQKHVGSSPAKTLRNMRLETAHGLLAETDMSLSDIALASGFPSYLSFRGAYQKRFGTTPLIRFGQRHIEHG